MLNKIKYHQLRLFQYASRVWWSSPLLSKTSKETHLISLYRQTTHFLNQLHEPYWIDFGTLLGYHRENGIIAHDVDVDFSMSVTSYPKVLANRHLLPKGFTLHDTSWRHHGPKLYISYRGFDADIYFYADEGDFIRSLEKTKWQNERQPVPKELIYPLQSTLFLGEKTFIPAQQAAYLTYLYGYTGTGGKRDPKTGFWHAPQ